MILNSPKALATQRPQGDAVRCVSKSFREGEERAASIHRPGNGGKRVDRSIGHLKRNVRGRNRQDVPRSACPRAGRQKRRPLHRCPVVSCIVARSRKAAGRVVGSTLAVHGKPLLWHGYDARAKVELINAPPLHPSVLIRGKEPLTTFSFFIIIPHGCGRRAFRIAFRCGALRGRSFQRRYCFGHHVEAHACVLHHNCFGKFARRDRCGGRRARC